MKRTRGGQKKHWAERARLLVWYKEIRRRCGWDYRKLDQEFSLPKITGVPQKNGEPPRTFEWIHKFARMPRGGGACPYTIKQLVEVVNQSSPFEGTQGYFSAKFWDWLQQQTFAAADVTSDIDQLLRNNNLIRVNPENHAGISDLIARYDLGAIYDRCIRLSLRGMTMLPGLELIWLLYIQNEPIHNYPVRAALEKIADQRLQAFFYNYFPEKDECFDYYGDAVNALLNTKLDLSGRQTNGYGYLEIVGGWPIIPEKLLDSISENHLFHPLELLS